MGTPPPLRVRDPPSPTRKGPPPLRVRDPWVRIDFEKKVDPLQIVFTFEGTPVFPRAGGSVFLIALLEPFTPGARRSHSPASADLCFHLFCVRPFGTIYPRAGGFVFF